VGTVTGRSFSARLVDRVEAVSSVLCLGLDPRPPFPDPCMRGLAAGRSGLARAAERYCLGALEAAAGVAAAVKPQVALFEVLGGYGLTALERVCAAAHELGIPVIADGKRGDIPSTAEAYAAAWLRPRGDELAVADALTVSPYLGADSLEPFLRACDDVAAGVYVLVRTSNPGSAGLQELTLAGGEPVWQRVAEMVADAGAGRVDGCGLAPVGAVVGLTQPAALARARELMPHAPLLIPGLGAQGGDPRAAEPAFRPHPAGGLVVVARSVLEAWRGAEGDWRAAVGEAARDASEATWRVAVDAAHR
jgi:orotidine-5'-phosphate decarboxylase